MNQRRDITQECKKRSVSDAVSDALKESQAKRIKKLGNALLEDDPCRKMTMNYDNSVGEYNLQIKQLKFQDNEAMKLKVAKIEDNCILLTYLRAQPMFTIPTSMLGQRLMPWISRRHRR